jgi:hypothetical protein
LVAATFLFSGIIILSSHENKNVEYVITDSNGQIIEAPENENSRRLKRLGYFQFTASFIFLIYGIKLKKNKT